MPCEFCEIVRKQRAAYVVWEDEKVAAFLDMDPIHEGHVLVVPKIHVASIDEMPDDVLLAVMRAARKIASALHEVYGCPGYGFMQNGGIFCDYGHAHFHVFPRYEGDGFGFTYPDGEFEYSAAVAGKIREKL